MLQIHQFPCLSDNYGFLLHDDESGETAAIDTPDGEEYLRAARARGWEITQIWNTHWHPDHAGGNKQVIAATGAPVIAPREVEKLSPIDWVVSHGDKVRLGKYEAQVIDVGGHTVGHVAYFIAQTGSDHPIALVGDSVFALGCGRMFEGTPEQFWTSLKRIRDLPAASLLYCAHEYTESNAAFALHADPGNQALIAYAREVKDKRARNEPTVPTLLSREIETNPFLRADDPAIQARWGGHAPHETFAALRAAKDNFRG